MTEPVVRLQEESAKACSSARIAIGIMLDGPTYKHSSCAGIGRQISQMLKSRRTPWPKASIHRSLGHSPRCRESLGIFVLKVPSTQHSLYREVTEIVANAESEPNYQSVPGHLPHPRHTACVVHGYDDWK